MPQSHFLQCAEVYFFLPAVCYRHHGHEITVT